MPSVTGAGSPLPLSRGMPVRGRRRASLEVTVDAGETPGETPVVAHRTAVEGIEAAGIAARTQGHTLAGFVRRCTASGCSFVARCRVCGTEVAVQRATAGWGHTPPLPVCDQPRSAGRPGLAPSANGA